MCAERSFSLVMECMQVYVILRLQRGLWCNLLLLCLLIFFNLLSLFTILDPYLPHLAPDRTIIQQRIRDVQFVLADFKARHEEGRYKKILCIFAKSFLSDLWLRVLLLFLSSWLAFEKLFFFFILVHHANIWINWLGKWLILFAIVTVGVDRTMWTSCAKTCVPTMAITSFWWRSSWICSL